MKYVQQSFINKGDKVNIRTYKNIFPELSVMEGLILREKLTLVLSSLEQSEIMIAYEDHPGIMWT